jgi:hypothetical protein
MCSLTLPDTIFRLVSRLGNARHLEQGALGRDIGVEPAAGRGDEINRDGRRGVLLLQLFDIGVDAVDERLVGEPEMGATGIRRIVGLGTVFVESCGSGITVAEGRPWK